MNANTFEVNGYSVITSLNERNIYIKCLDQINFINYETNLDQKEVRLQFDLSDIYNIINNCFKFEEGYSVNFNISSGNMKLIFNALVGGFLKINFEALLREKILSNDGQLTVKFNTMEQKYESLVKNFENFVKKYEKTQEENMRLFDVISNAEIILSPHEKVGQCTIFPEHIYKINSKSISIECGINRYGGGLKEPSLDRINEFYQLEKLEINYYRHTNLNMMKNDTLNALKIHCQNEQCLTSILGINKFPELKLFEIHNAPGLTEIVSILNKYKHKINTIILANCKAVNVVELQTYCQVNNIKLNIS